MILSDILRILLLILLIVCAISVNLTKRLLPAIVIFMSYSTIMSLIWLITESPDLAITEAAVGAGVTSILFFLTLRKLRREDFSDDSLPVTRKDPDDPAGPAADISAADHDNDAARIGKEDSV